MTVRNAWNRLLVAVTITPLALGGLLTQSAYATWVRSLYAGQSDWATVTLLEGNHTIVASTLWSLGDVDIELYDSTRQTLIGRSNKLGNESMNVTVYQAGTFHIKYSMPMCVNPLGACAVEINIY